MPGVTLPLEMEPMQVATSGSIPPEQRKQTTSSLSYRIEQLTMMIKMYVEYYPKTASSLAAIGVGVLFLFFVLSFRQPVTRNRLYHDYSEIDMHYNFKASQLDHWCLWGGDDQCKCDDFTEPLSRDEKKDWLKTHRENVDLIDLTKEYDVVFYGDELVEGWNGLWLGKPTLPVVQGTKVQKYFAQTFTKDGGGGFEGLALGIMGDVVRVHAFERSNKSYRIRMFELAPRSKTTFACMLLSLRFMCSLTTRMNRRLPTFYGAYDTERCLRLSTRKSFGWRSV